ncbi:MAG: hypothetical protein Q8R82_03455 [Hyphomonadaceae bacterium]|nr:hypothetical protein [Hyphomonadaceae bacterium]
MELPENIKSLHSEEEFLRAKALELMAQDQRFTLHLAVVEQAMNLGDLLRKFPTSDEDLKVVQVLGMRVFNAFGAGLKLALSGYMQNSVLVMRDILETVFLIDLFRGDRAQIARWRAADRKTLRDEFSPASVRKTLDIREGQTTKRREQLYKLFSELAGHPTMKSDWMMRPEKDGDAVIGPFMEKTALEAVLSEMGRLAVQSGEHLSAFFPKEWEAAIEPRQGFARAANDWMAAFYTKA